MARHGVIWKDNMKNTRRTMSEQMRRRLLGKENLFDKKGVCSTTAKHSSRQIVGRKFRKDGVAI
jgi:hypothetical protein